MARTGRHSAHVAVHGPAPASDQALTAETKAAAPTGLGSRPRVWAVLGAVAVLAVLAVLAVSLVWWRVWTAQPTVSPTSTAAGQRATALQGGAISRRDLVRTATPTPPATPAKTGGSDSAAKTKDDQSSAGSTAPASLQAVKTAVAGLQARGIRVGVAVAPMGGRATLAAGEWTGGEAWSTIKVPLSVAASRAGRGVNVSGHDHFPYGSCSSYGSVDSAIRQALTISDNCAAWQLWEGLGGDNSGAAGLVDQVLRDGGDTDTQVVSNGNGERLTSGMSQWSLVDQATFAAHLPSLVGAATAWSDMGLPKGDASAGQGLNIIAGAHAKAGWGDAAPGGPVTRQFGVIPLSNGKCAAAAIGTSYSSQAFSVLTQLAQALQADAANLPSGACPAGL